MAGKMKSPNYPSVGLRDAIESVRKLWDAEKRTSVDGTTAVKAMGYGALSGSAAVRLSALRKYGLIESDGKGVRVSQLAMKILHTPEGSDDWRAAIQEAAQKPELFRELMSTHAEASDQVLRSYLMVKKEFSESGANNFIAALRDTLDLARSAGLGYSSDNEEAQPMAGTMHAVPHPAGDIRPQIAPAVPSSRVYSWPLDDDTTAEVRIVGTQISRAHLDALIEYLEVAKKRLSDRRREDA